MTASEQTLMKGDPTLESVILRVPKPVIESSNNVFHDIMSCIIEQQIHYRSTKNVFAKALDRASIEYLTLDNFHVLEEHALRHMKLGAGKYETMMQCIDYWCSNRKDFKTLSDEEVITELSSIKGIGRWTMDMILLYTLKRPNVFPYDDYHLKQIMVSLYGLNPKLRLKAQMLEIAENWGQMRSLAVLYLFAWKHKGKSA